MARMKSEKLEKEAVKSVAAMMAASARTAPKARGMDAIETLVIDGEDLETLALAMEEKAKEQPAFLAPAFNRDARNVRGSLAVLLVGVTGGPKKPEQGFDCGACGYKSCQQLLKARTLEGKDFSGPVCVFQAIDLGIALGAAAKLAGDLNVDNRMMYTVGTAARKLKLLSSDVIIGIPLSVSGKSPYFDR
ncbi:MAG: DUF2148 domain-containing protein [Chloroflexota bacterium]|nr:DUF2148 domain-containing protein [Chloroflexota bacterium]